MTTEEKEKIYDDEIAPRLLEIAKRCQELEFSIIASVEWAWGETGKTESLAKGHSAKQLLSHWAVRSNGNVDKLFMAVDKHAKEHGHSSAYLYRLGNKNIKYSGDEVAALTIVQPQ